MGDFGAFPLVFMGGGGAKVDAEAISCVPRGGCDTISISWNGVNTICGVGGRVGGSRYHTRIPKVKIRRLRVAMTYLLMMSEGGKRMGIMCTGNEP